MLYYLFINGSSASWGGRGWSLSVITDQIKIWEDANPGNNYSIISWAV